jgi:hypothetical protein
MQQQEVYRRKFLAWEREARRDFIDVAPDSEDEVLYDDDEEYCEMEDVTPATGARLRVIWRGRGHDRRFRCTREPNGLGLCTRCPGRLDSETHRVRGPA